MTQNHLFSKNTYHIIKDITQWEVERMRLKEKFDLMEITKRALLVDRNEVIKHIIRGVKNRFNLEILFAYLNPNFTNTTDYFIVASMPKDNRIVVFHAIAFGECSTTQFDMYAAKGKAAIDDFFGNLMDNATVYPVSVFDQMIRSKQLSVNKSNPKYWMSSDPEIASKVIEMLEEVTPGLSHKKTVAQRGRR